MSLEAFLEAQNVTGQSFMEWLKEIHWILRVVKLWASEVRATEERAHSDPEVWSLETVNTWDALTGSLSRAHSSFRHSGKTWWNPNSTEFWVSSGTQVTKDTELGTLGSAKRQFLKRKWEVISDLKMLQELALLPKINTYSCLLSFSVWFWGFGVCHNAVRSINKQ